MHAAAGAGLQRPPAKILKLYSASSRRPSRRKQRATTRRSANAKLVRVSCPARRRRTLHSRPLTADRAMSTGSVMLLGHVGTDCSVSLTPGQPLLHWQLRRPYQLQLRRQCWAPHAEMPSDLTRLTSPDTSCGLHSIHDCWHQLRLPSQVTRSQVAHRGTSTTSYRLKSNCFEPGSTVLHVKQEQAGSTGTT